MAAAFFLNLGKIRSFVHSKQLQSEHSTYLNKGRRKTNGCLMFQISIKFFRASLMNKNL